jgi:hypothetical protein
MAPIAPFADPLSPRRLAFAALKAGLSGAPQGELAVEGIIATAVPSLDRMLGGGFPSGMLVTFEGDAGGWSIGARLLARVTCTGLAAVVDDGGLYPPSLARAGARLERVLVVPAKTPLAVARAADTLLRSRACRLVLMPAVALRDAVWMRLATLAHRTGVLLIAIATRAVAPAAAAAAGLRLRCRREGLAVHGTRGLWSIFAGYDVRAEVCKGSNRAASGASARVRVVEILDGLTPRTRAVARPKAFLDVAVR